MKKVISLLMICFCISTLFACNSPEDIKPISQKDMIKYVDKAIGEDISFVSVESNDRDHSKTFIFNLDKRNITFTAESVITAPFVDGTQFGNFKEEIYINYERDIAESEYCILERERIARELKIDDEDMEYGLAIVRVNNYNDIDKLAKFIMRLDELYEFNEKKPELIRHVDAGALSFSKNSIEAPKFSTNRKNRLKYDDVYKEIVTSYIKQLKRFGDFDSTIPEDVWNNVSLWLKVGVVWKVYDKHYDDLSEIINESGELLGCLLEEEPIKLIDDKELKNEVCKFE